MFDIASGRVYNVRHLKINESVYPAKEWNVRGESIGALNIWVEEMSQKSIDYDEYDDDHQLSTVDGDTNDDNTQIEAIENSLTYVLPQITEEVSQPEGNERRYPMRNRAPPARYEQEQKLSLVAMENEKLSPPKSLAEVRERKGSSMWMQAVDEEINSLKENEDWQIASLPEGAKAIDSRFVFVLKLNADGSVDKYKARLVAKGFQEGYVENVYAPVVDFSTVRLVLSILSREGGFIHQMDVKSAFLNGRLKKDECLYMNSPEGLDLGVKKGQVLKILKAMYGFKRAPKIWSSTWNSAMRRLGFSRLKSDECFYIIKVLTSTLYVLVYVDDVWVIGTLEDAVILVKRMLMREFEMKDLGVAKSFLGVEFIQTVEGISLRQEY